TASASVKGFFATDYKTKVIGKYEDARSRLTSRRKETFSEEDLSNLRRSLELWQSAVEATIRRKVIREVVHKLSPDHSQQPSPFTDEERGKHTDEPNEPWIEETPDEAEEYVEETEKMLRRQKNT
ncbi:hypothetical protein EI94DRAFT_1703396, partial [Lactarius quietus]